jgi:hypothetical protein
MSCRRGPRLLHITEEAKEAFEYLICKGTLDGHIVVGRRGDGGCGARDRCESALLLGGANYLVVLFGRVVAHARLLRFILSVWSGGLFVNDSDRNELLKQPSVRIGIRGVTVLSPFCQHVCNTRKVDAR